MKYAYRFKDEIDKKNAMKLLEEKYRVSVGEFDRWIELGSNDIITELNEEEIKKALPGIQFKLVEKRESKLSEVLEKLIKNIVEAIHFPP